jgi:transposase
MIRAYKFRLYPSKLQDTEMRKHLWLSKKHLWDRIHDCPSCGYSADRDLNAAQVILKRATLGHSGCNACGVGT